MALDFTGLNQIPTASGSPAPDKEETAPPLASEVMQLQREADSEAQKQIEAREIYARYQAAILRCEMLTSELLKQSAAGAPLEQLLLLAVELVDRAIGDTSTTALKVLRRNLYEQYGIGESPY